jgi:peptidoglycan/LPS O-acetylase OafA/YrhL
MGEERIHGPDVLRGIAAIGVVFFHVLYLSGIPIHPTGAALVGRFDFFVRVFFVLSAFSIAYAYSSRLTGVDAVRNFYLKRFFRIAPLFYFVLLFNVLYTLAMGRSAPSEFDILLNMSFLFSFVPGKHDGLVGGGWSIGVEWIYYAFFPLMIALIRGWRSALGAWLLLCAIAVMGRPYFNQFMGGELRVFGLLYFLSHAQYFVIGLFVFHVFNRFPISHRHHLVQQVSGVAFFLTLAGTISWFRLQSSLPEEIFLSFACLLMVFLAVLGFPVWLDNKVTRWFGLVSYSIYLVQFPIIQILNEHGFYAFVMSRFGSGLASFFCASLATLIVTLVISAFTYQFVEKPGQQLFFKLLKRGGKVTSIVEPSSSTLRTEGTGSVSP